MNIRYPLRGSLSNTYRGDTMFYRFATVGHICRELHQFPVQACARRIDVTRGICPRYMSGISRVVAPRLVYM